VRSIKTKEVSFVGLGEVLCGAVLNTVELFCVVVLNCYAGQELVAQFVDLLSIVCSQSNHPLQHSLPHIT
jgi:hypothetical protein